MTHNLFDSPNEEVKTEDSTTRNEFQEVVSLFPAIKATHENATPVIMEYYMAKNEFSNVEQKFIRTMVAVYKAGLMFAKAKSATDNKRNYEYHALAAAESNAENQDRIAVLENERKTVIAMSQELNLLELLHCRCTP